MILILGDEDDALTTMKVAKPANTQWRDEFEAKPKALSEDQREKASTAIDLTKSVFSGAQVFASFQYLMIIVVLSKLLLNRCAQFCS